MEAFRGMFIICMDVKDNRKKLRKKRLWKLIKFSGPLSQDTPELKTSEAEKYLGKYCYVLALCQLLLETGHWVRKTFGLSWCASYYVHTLKINFWNWTSRKQKLKKSHLPISVFKQARLIDNWHALTLPNLSRSNAWQLCFYPTFFQLFSFFI